MTRRAADVAGVGPHGAEGEAHAREDALVRLVHGLVACARTGFITIKRVRVLHREFAPAHDAKARAALVAEFGLNMVKVDRQLFIAFELVAYDVSDHFFGRRLDDEVAVVTILQAQ